MRNSLLYILSFFAVIVTVISGCDEVPEYRNDPIGNFDALADIVGTHYCYFREKDIDWQKTCAQYRGRITSDTRPIELFTIMSELLDELQDGHVNLSSRFNTSYYRKWWSEYPQDFNLRTLQEYYLKFNYRQTSGISYAMFPDSIAYMYYPSFNSGISDTNLDYILALLQDSKGLIIDVRNNGGGLLTNINTLVSRFIDEEITGGYIRHKTGPDPGDFSGPYPIVYKPAEKGRICYRKPVVVLTNRSCFSAANDFVSVMKQLPQVRICGARTGGGGGLPFSSELPIGWSVRFSASPISDSEDRVTEFGIDPSEGYEVHDTDEELAAGQDHILDFAINALR